PNDPMDECPRPASMASASGPSSWRTRKTTLRPEIFTPFERQDQIVGRHLRKLEKCKLAAVRESGKIGHIAQAPFGILPLQAQIECRIARGRVPAVAHEWSVDEQPATRAQIAGRTDHETLRHPP